MNTERKRMKNACTNSLAAFLSWYNMVHLCGAISGLQVIDCYPCPMAGIGKSKLVEKIDSSLGPSLRHIFQDLSNSFQDLSNSFQDLSNSF